LRITPIKPDISQITEINSSPVISNPMMNIPSQLSIISYSPRVPLVRFIDDPNSKLRTSNSQRLMCIQNVLSHHPPSRITTNEISTRKSFLRSKSSHANLSDSSSMKKRPLEKENCSVITNSTSDIVLKTTSPYVTANDHRPYRSSLFSIEWCRSNIPRLLRRLVPIIRENIR